MTDPLFMTIFSGLWGLLILVMTGISGWTAKTIINLSKDVVALRLDVALLNQKMELSHA